MCDFDGDRLGDLAVGVPGEDFGRGGVNVQYNHGGFLNAPVFLQAKHSQGDQVTKGAGFGAALACGDFNGDGVGDLAVGARGTSFGGSVWILWGKPGAGLDAGSYLEFHQADARIPGSAEGSFGFALAVGDFNRDDVDDLAIGDPFEPVPDSKYEFGTVIVVPGRAGGLTFEGVQQLRGGHVLDGDTVRYFGWSLAAGPLVTGGGDDLVVGAPGTGWKNSGTSAGRAYLFRDHGGLVSHQVIDEVSLASEGLPNIYGKPESHADFGYSLATGDFNGDGKVDLAIGIPGKSIAGVAGPGAVVVVPGNGVGVDLASEDYLVQEDVGGDSEPADAYGWSLAAGNWNVDQFDDLAIGNPFEDVEVASGNPGVNRAGAVFVHYGAANLALGTGLILRQGSGLTPGVPAENDWFGQSLASVRLGTVDLDFLVIGIPGERAAGLNPDCNLAGAVQLAISWANAGPIADPTYLLHQDTGNPYNVADQRECTTATTPVIMGYGEPLPAGPYGEFFGWAAGQ